MRQAADEIERLQSRVVTCHEIMADLYALVNPNDDPELMDKAALEMENCDCPPNSEYEEMQSRIEQLEKEKRECEQTSDDIGYHPLLEWTWGIVRREGCDTEEKKHKWAILRQKCAHCNGRRWVKK